MDKIVAPLGLAQDIRQLLQEREISFTEKRGFVFSTFLGDFGTVAEEIEMVESDYVRRDAW